jgi:hypothetical protein
MEPYALRSPHLPGPPLPKRGGRKTSSMEVSLLLFPSLPPGERGQGSEGFGGHTGLLLQTLLKV